MVSEDDRRITPFTRCCAVFGHPVRHSGSPGMHNAALRRLGLDWRYLAFDVLPSSLYQAVLGARDMGWVGINLTVPHKLEAMNLVDVIDDSAREWGAVNTIRFEGRAGGGSWQSMASSEADGIGERRMVGYNTDADAVIRAIGEELDLRPGGLAALVIGLGGAGRVAALKLAASGADRLFLVNRTREKAERVAGEIGERFSACEVRIGYPEEPVDLLVNGTSLGLREGDPFPVDERRFPMERASAVFDMIYQPARTPLLERAAEAGCRTANGLGMLVHQGARALEIWTEGEVPVGVMRQALEEHVYGT